MPKVHSHYENLKVARDASPEDIRAAYRALTRKHHPDRHPDNADAERVMSVINVAYGVLSDPFKRSEHDRWIAQAEAQPGRPTRAKPTLHSPSARYRQAARAAGDVAAQRRARLTRFERQLQRAIVHMLGHRVAYALGGAAALGLAIAGLSSLFEPGLVAPSAGTAAMATSMAAPGYTRPANAPNGQHWPAHSGYVDGYEQLNKGGLSEVTIDNSANDADMFAKLVSLDGPGARPVRTVFVAARSRFTLVGLTIGTYDLRYRNLTSGGLLRSPAFILEEVSMAGGTQHNTTTVRLHKPGDGSLQTYALGDAEF